MPRAPSSSHSSGYSEPYARPRSYNNSSNSTSVSKNTQHFTLDSGSLSSTRTTNWHGKPTPPKSRHRHSTTGLAATGMASGSRPGRSPIESSQQGRKLVDLPVENQRQVEQAARTLSSWERLAIHSIARGESIPQTRLRETQLLIRAADGTPPGPLGPANGPHPTPYTGSTYREAVHSAPPNPNTIGLATQQQQHHHHHQGHAGTGRHLQGPPDQQQQQQHLQRQHQPHYPGYNHGQQQQMYVGGPAGHTVHRNSGKTPIYTAGGGATTDEESDAWFDDVDVPWEDRFKVGKRERKGDDRGGSGSGAGAGAVAGAGSARRDRAGDGSSKGRKRTR